MLMNWTDQAVHKWETSQKKSYYSILTLTNLKYCISYTTWSSERGTKNRHQINFWKVWTIYIENWLVQEKSKQGGLRIYLSEKNLLEFSDLPLITFRNSGENKLSPWKFCKICDTPWKFQGQIFHGNSMSCSWTTLGIPLF